MRENNQAKSKSLLQAHEDLRGAARLATLGRRGDVAFELRGGKTTMWVVARRGRAELLALRSGLDADVDGEPIVSDTPDGHVCEWQTALGAMRLKIAFPAEGRATVRCTTSLLPVREVCPTSVSRDLFVLNDAAGTIHTTQRGLRSGVFFASYTDPSPFSVIYLQEFSSLTEFFEVTGGSPAGTVGGTLAEAGYRPPFGEHCILPKSRELIISDAYLALLPDAPEGAGEIARRYLDLLADMYLSIPRPDVEYHDWPSRAERTLRDLSLSPACTYERGGQRYLMPYVGDTEKPPESMVQLTVLVNALEYDGWRSATSALTRSLLEGISRFYDPDIGSVVRWLPEESFGQQSEENMNHESMDSWYLYHALFNLSRLARMGNGSALEIFRKSLPFAVRVARRFDYRWPIFFHLKTLDIIHAESAPGEGGENDVAGLYALVMLHAHELFGDAEHLTEAERAIAAMRDCGFNLGYQMNTTGFAAEATLRLWLLTKRPAYLELSEVCMANLFDNMWLWRCDYGRAWHYRTFFGMFPLHDAPYLAAYEELEAQAKFHELSCARWCRHPARVAVAACRVPKIQPRPRLVLLPRRTTDRKSCGQGAKRPDRTGAVGPARGSAGRMDTMRHGRARTLRVRFGVRLHDPPLRALPRGERPDLLHVSARGVHVGCPRKQPDRDLS